MAGALAERVFAEKIDRAGFEGIVIGERRPFSIDDVASIPLFTPELLALMRSVIPAAEHGHVATSVIAWARKPRD